MNSIPDEVLERILRFLPLGEQMYCERVCSKWHRILQSFWVERDGLRVENSGISVLRQEIVDAYCEYKHPLESLWKCVCVRLNGRVKSFRADRTPSRFNATFLAQVPWYFPTLETLFLNSMCFIYPENELSTVPTLAPVVSLPTLRSITLTHNTIVQVDMRNWSHSRHWAIGTVCPVVQLYPSGLDQISTNLTELRLESVLIATRTFISLCQRLAHTLERLCLKLDDCSMQKSVIVDGLGQLTNLVHLNIGSRRPQTKTSASLLDNTNLEALINRLNRLETFSLRGAPHVSSTGVNSVINSQCGRSTLRYLNISRCPMVNQNLASAVECRRVDSPMLTVYAYLTDINVNWARRMSSRNCLVVVEDKDFDESVFFGEKEACELVEIPSCDLVDEEDVPDFVSESDSFDSS